MTKSLNCQIRVKGHLSGHWVDWFDGLELDNQPSGEAVLSVYLPDQAALYGVLKRMSNLGVALISVNCAECCPDESSTQPPSER
jgi:hypothetical protein